MRRRKTSDEPGYLQACLAWVLLLVLSDDFRCSEELERVEECGELLDSAR
jgi:hypothetical protein